MKATRPTNRPYRTGGLWTPPYKPTNRCRTRRLPMRWMQAELNQLLAYRESSHPEPTCRFGLIALGEADRLPAVLSMNLTNGSLISNDLRGLRFLGAMRARMSGGSHFAGWTSSQTSWRRSPGWGVSAGQGRARCGMRTRAFSAEAGAPALKPSPRPSTSKALNVIYGRSRAGAARTSPLDRGAGGTCRTLLEQIDLKVCDICPRVLAPPGPKRQPPAP